MAKDQELIIRINGEVKGYQDALKDVSKQTQNLQDQLTSIAKTSAVAFLGFGAAIGFATRQAAKFETISTQFEVLVGDVGEAKAVLKDLSDFSARTPFKFEQIAQAGKQLLGFKIASDQIKGALQKIGDVAAVTGSNFGELSTIFGQVKAAGKLTGERLLQLQERAVPIGSALAKTMGVAESAITDMVSKGQVNFKIFEKAFASLSEKGGIAFEGMQKNSETLEGQLSTLSDNFDLVTAAIGKNFLPTVKTITASLIRFFTVIRENPALSKLISKVLIFGTVTTAIIAGVSLLAIGFLKLRAAIIVSTLATRGLSFAVKGLMGATGIGLIITFLPEILTLFKAVFVGARNIVANSGDAIVKAVAALGKVIFGLLTFNFFSIRDGLGEFKEAFSKVADATVNEFKRATAEVSDSEKKAADAIESASDKKIAQSKRVTDELDVALEARKRKLSNEKELLIASNQKLETEQISFIKRRQAIQEESLEASSIQDKSEKALALENIRLKNEQLLAEETKFNTERGELRTNSGAMASTQSELELENRRQALADENELLSVSRSENEKQEADFLSRKQELRNEQVAASSISDAQERELALENAALKHEQLNAEEAEFFIARDELRAEQTEKEAELQLELQELSKEQREALTEEDLEQLRKSLLTKQQMNAKFTKDELKKARKEKETLLLEEKKHGTAIAKFKQFQRSEGLSNAKTAANELSQLQNSSNEKQRAIGKAAALVQIGIDTARGAISAFTALSGIPIVGPVLGAAAAAALTSFGLERARKVQAAQQGGVVSGTGSGDTQPFLLEPGELITPKQNFDEVINAVVNQRTQEAPAEEDAEESRMNIDIGFDGDEAADVLTVKQNESRVLGISQEF